MRIRPLSLAEQYRQMGGYMGGVWVVIGLTIVAPLLAYPVWGSGVQEIGAFLLPGGGLAAVGGLMAWRWWPRQPTLPPSFLDGTVIILLAWLTAIGVGSIPLAWLNNLTFTQAMFESTSGWTTTGLSVLDVTAVSPLTLLYRSTIQLAGGAGFAIIMLTALVGPVGTGLSSAEGRAEQLLPNVRRSAILVLKLYVWYNIFGIIALTLAGMTVFDAINHAFTALSTGGFSTRAESIGYWDSPLVEAVIIVLMLLGTVNFVVGYTLLQGKWRAVLRTGEIKTLGFLLATAIPITFFGVTWGLYPTLDKSVRVAIFEITSAISTCGFGTVGYGNWPSLGILIMIMMMLVGGGSGATAGGIKQYRVYLLYRALLWEIKRLFLPQRVQTAPTIWHAEELRFVNDAQIRQTALYVFLHVLTFLIGSLIIAAHGYSLSESMFELASSVSTIGLSVGVTAPNAPTAVLWTQIVVMFLGRLEFFAVLAGLGRLWQDGRRLVTH